MVQFFSFSASHLSVASGGLSGSNNLVYISSPSHIMTKHDSWQDDNQSSGKAMAVHFGIPVALRVILLCF